MNAEIFAAYDPRCMRSSNRMGIWCISIQPHLPHSYDGLSDQSFRYGSPDLYRIDRLPAFKETTLLR